MERLRQMRSAGARSHEILTSFSFGNAFLELDAVISGKLPEYFEGWKRSGVNVSHCTVGQFGARPMTFDNAIRDIAKFTALLDARDELLKITRTGDAAATRESGRYGIILGFQDTTALDGRLDRVDLFHALGIRVIQLTVNHRNLAGDGCAEERPAGLSLFGVDLVKKLNESGILVDVSHCSDQTALDAVKHSGVPVAMTHTAARAIYNHYRWKPDEVLAAVGETSGYIGMPLLNGGLKITDDPDPSLDHSMAHFNHIVAVAGAEHVGVASNGDNWPRPITWRAPTPMR